MILKPAYLDTHFSCKKQKAKSSVHMEQMTILFYFEKVLSITHSKIIISVKIRSIVKSIFLHKK